ncbi:MAG: elongation factor Ts [bacterium]|nr:elongation factor Ts [bacterium]
MVNTDTIKELRDSTGVSVMQCKFALEEALGDKEKALIILKKKGIEAALKKSDRNLNAGIIASYIHSTGTIGAMVELACETDFVSKNSEFKQLAYDIAMHIAASNPESENVLLDQPFIKNPEITVGALVNNAIQKFGEKTEIVRFIRYVALEK